MKIRIGIGFGPWPFATAEPRAILDFIDFCEALKIDSLWLSDRLIAADLTLEPITFMAYMASRLRNMKFGTSALVLPTRNPVILAKELATLDFLSRGRLLIVVGLGTDDSRDFAAVGIRKEERGRRADEAITLMRRLWLEENVTFDGKFFSVADLTLKPRPFQKNGPPLWVGGRSEAALRRAGALADGWLTSTATPEEVGRGIAAIRRHAEARGREVPEDHYGVVVPFCFAPSRDEALEIAKPLIRSRTDCSPFEYTVLGPPGEARRQIERYVAHGASKFVMRPCAPAAAWKEQLGILAREIIEPLQTPFSAAERREREGVAPPEK